MRDNDYHSWWPDSPDDITVAKVVAPSGPIGYVVVRTTQIGVGVVISELGPGAIYSTFEQADRYAQALVKIIESSEYKRYREASRKILDNLEVIW
jgi:hypothetical protein